MNIYRCIKSIALIFFISVILLELGSLLLFKQLTGDQFTYNTVSKNKIERKNELKSYLSASGRNETTNPLHKIYTVNPYYGYDAKSSNWNFLIPNGQDASTQDEDVFNIVVTGGSVAAWFVVQGAPHLSRHLKDTAYFRDKKLRFIRVAEGGYKQPQPLFKLIVYLLHKTKVDMVLNIDGYNDLVMAAENMESQVNPIYPSVNHTAFLHQLLRNHGDPEVFIATARIYSTRANELSILSFSSKSPWRYSVFVNLVSKLMSLKSQNQIYRLNKQILDKLSAGEETPFSGPASHCSLRDYDCIARIWSDVSLLYFYLTQGKEIPYLHFLQPNQYYNGSKNLSEKELKDAFQPDHQWARIAKAGYPKLVEQGQLLAQQQFPFYDLTLVFKNAKEDIYIDTCCHVNERGNEILAKHIADAILKELDI